MSVFFDRIIVIGVGMIGGSLALASKSHGVTGRVIGVDRSRESLDTARSRKILDVALEESEWERALDELKSGESVLVVLCTPVAAIPSWGSRIFKAFDERFGEDAVHLLMTDVGSTKEVCCQSIDDLRFIGSHPIAGSERSGPGASDVRLFHGRTTVITPTERHNRDDVWRLRLFWESLGAISLELEADRHDEIFAVTSHLPHLISAALAMLPSEEERRLTGPGFAGMTRLAASSPEVWTDILLENRKSLLAALERLESILHRIAEGLRDDDVTAIKEFLAQAKNAGSP